jgi:hypothetical protein
MNGFYLQNSEEQLGTRISWWGDSGYTSNLALARVFTKDEAVAQHQERNSQMPWPIEFVDPKAHLAVDCQYVREQELAALPADTPCYVQLNQAWDGNDLYWATPDGGFDVNLDIAQVYSLDEALLRYGAEGHCRTIWPKDYIDGKARRVANKNDMTISDALAGTGITLIKRPIIKQRLTCYGCRRFLSEIQFWHTCPHCGASNRP